MVPSEDQQEKLVSWRSGSAVLSCIVSSRYLATTSEQTEDFMCAIVVVIYRVLKLVTVLQLIVLTSYKCSINLTINPNLMSSQQLMTIY
jgi:hypothetical protein